MSGSTTTISDAERHARLDGPIHTFFGLSYSSYQVLPRTLMQSMPVDWQQRMVTCLNELRDAFEHIEHPDTYKVTAAVECTYSDLNATDMAELGITQPDAPDGENDEPEDVFYDKDGTEHQAGETLLTPRLGGDPIPHYNRGRTFIEPRV